MSAAGLFILPLLAYFFVFLLPFLGWFIAGLLVFAVVLWLVVDAVLIQGTSRSRTRASRKRRPWDVAKLVRSLGRLRDQRQGAPVRAVDRGTRVSPIGQVDS